jgi:hypothetical protein
LHNEEVHGLNSLPVFINDQIKEDGMGGAHDMHRREANAHRILVGMPEGSDHLQDIGVHRRILLKWLLINMGGSGLDLFGPR